MTWLRHDTWADTLAPAGYTAPVWVGIYYSGSYHDITAYVNAEDGIDIARGRPNESGQPDPARLELTLKNDTGRFSPRNPNSPLYGLIGRNTPIQVWVNVNATWYQRFQGEVTSWPQKWGTKGSVQSFAPIEASGIMRRLGQGASPLRSPYYRGITGIGADLVAYWPCEDSVGASTVAPAKGDRKGRAIGSPVFANYDDLTASAPLPTLGTGRFVFDVSPYTNTNEAQVRFIAAFPSTPLPNNSIIARVYTNNSLGWWDLIYTTAGGGSLGLQPYTNANVATSAIGAVAFGVDGEAYRIDMEGAKNGSGIDFTLVALLVGAGSAYVGSANVASATLGSITRVDINPLSAALTGLSVGHVTVEKNITTVFDLQSQSRAYAGERATARLARLGTENGITVTVVSDDGESQYLGIQEQTDLVSLLQDAADVDSGILFETRNAGTLTYRPPSSIYSQTTADCTVTYSDNLLIPFEPVDDDEPARNKVTITRMGGAAATVEDTTSPMGTAAPPTGVGTYDEAKTLRLGYDVQARHQAGWRVHLGTVNESRWPQIGIDLAHPTVKADTTLQAALLNLDIGDRLDVTTLPAWLPPDIVQAVVQGYRETIDATNYKIVFNASPFRPWRAARWKDTGIVDRWENSTTTLNEDLTTTETGADVAFTAGPAWTHADGDFDCMIGGERCTVTAVTGTSSPQEFTLTRSVNGVVKAQTSGTPVTLYDPTYYGL